MSVAFRRDSDEEHLEPKFEIPIPPGPNFVTANGLAQIGERIADLEARIAQGNADDVGLNAAKRDLRYWHTRQTTAVLVPMPSGDRVEFGTRDTFSLRGEARTLVIVGDDEAYPTKSLVSFSAPLSQALIGAEVGEVLAFGGDDDGIVVLEIAAFIAPFEEVKRP